MNQVVSIFLLNSCLFIAAFVCACEQQLRLKPSVVLERFYRCRCWICDLNKDKRNIGPPEIINVSDKKVPVYMLVVQMILNRIVLLVCLNEKTVQKVTPFLMISFSHHCFILCDAHICQIYIYNINNE